MRVNKYLIDTSAWIEYFRGTKTGEEVRKIVNEDKNICMHCNIILAELASKSIREGQNHEEVLNSVISLTVPAEEDRSIYEEAGALHGNQRLKGAELSLADAIIIAIAESNKCKIVTKDSHFKKFNAVLLK